jgi:hypothetical protein
VPEPGTIAFCTLAVAAFAIGRFPRIMLLQKRRIQFPFLVLLALGSICSLAWANTAPNPLESAYWRFEEGANLSAVNSAIADPVRDSINQNHLDAFDATTAPTYMNDLPPTPLKTGLSNALALKFTQHTGGGSDLFTLYNDGDFGKGLAKHINDGIVAPGSGFTVEAAFKANNTSPQYAAIISKEGQPAGSRPVQTFVVKTRGDNSRLQVELFDGNGNEKQVSSLSTVAANQWYYFAAVDNGSTLSLYLNSNNGLGYQLQGSVAINGALFQGVPANPLWDASWTVGRGQYAGNPTDWFSGIIDEVRITNSALAPSQFLFAPAGAGAGTGVPEPGAVLLSLLALGGFAIPVRRVRY